MLAIFPEILGRCPLAPRKSLSPLWEGKVLSCFSKVDERLRRVLKELDEVSRRSNFGDDHSVRAIALANRELNKALGLFDRCRKEMNRAAPERTSYFLGR